MDHHLLEHYLSMRRFAVVLVLGLAGCVVPSIPIPPPDPTAMTFHISGDAGNTHAVFSYPPDENYIGSIVYIYNRNAGVGIIEDAHDDGSVGPTAPVAATLGDQIIVSFQREDQTVSTCIRLREGTQSAVDYCGP
jgi:hypothetical protein